LICATDEFAFIDDPLRMLRAVQFSARFNFTIQKKTLLTIRDYSHLIKEITLERVLMEFQKVFDKKGNIVTFYNNLLDTQILKQLFEISSVVKDDELKKVKRLSEFLSVLIKDTSITDWSKFFSQKLKIDNKVFDELRVLEILHYTNVMRVSSFDNNEIVFKCLQIAPWFWESDFFSLSGINKKEWDENIFPKSYKHLAVNGDEMIQMGYEQGVEMGRKRLEILNLILQRKLNNTKEDLIKFLQK